MQRIVSILAIVSLSVVATAQNAAPHHHEHVKEPGQSGRISVLPVTTASPKARLLYQQAMTESMNFHLDRALEQWRAAVKLDPNFALANLMIAFRSQEPAEAKAALEKATAAAPKATQGERLLVRWIGGVREGNFVSGIAAMNDLIALYPHDKQLLSLAGNWLMVRYSYDRADALLDRALEVDQNYPPALNSAAYAHAQMGEFDDAIELIKRYTEVLANEPNAQDSYGEILRMAGNYDEAIRHYQAALKLAPDFSIMGLADTYLLKGDEEHARAGYLRCNAHAEMSEDKILCRLQYPITYVREKNYAAADRAFEATVQWAHARDLGFAEAQAHRMMSLYQDNDEMALKHLERAAAALNEHASVSKSDYQDEMARILRWRVARAAHAGNVKMAAGAMRELQTLAEANPSEIVQRSYDAAVGTQLMAEGRAGEAIPHLREDVKNAFSMALLVKAYEQTGDQRMAASERKELDNLHLPTIDCAIVTAGWRTAAAVR